MKKTQINVLKKASKVLHKEFDKTACKELTPTCPQCWIDLIIKQFDGLIHYCDESKWSIKDTK